MKIKKITSMLLSAVMVLALAATGCSGNNNSNSNGTSGNSGPATIKVWLPPYGTEDTLDKDFWTNTFKDFEKENNATVALEIVPWGDYETKYMTAISAGTGPDVGYMYMEMISDYIKMEALEPLESYLTSEDKDNYLYLDKCVISGKTYGLPIVVGNPRLLFCNMDILNKSGITTVPKTWDEFVTDAQKIKEDNPDVYPFLQEWGDPAIGALNSIFYPYLWQAGGEIFDDNGNVKFNDEAGLKAAKFLYDLKFTYKILPDVSSSLKGNDVADNFKAGKVAMAVMAATQATQIDKKGINWDVAVSLTDKTCGTFVAADSLVLLSQSNNKDLAWKCMKFMTSSTVMSSFHETLSMYPPIAKDETYADHEKLKPIYENDSEYFHTLPPISGSSKVYDTLYKNLQLMMLGQLSPEDALNNTATYAETVIKQ